MSLTKIFVKSKKSLIILGLSLLLIACLIVANYISLFVIKADNKSEEVIASETQLFMLSLSKSKVESEAKSIAPDYQEIGAGGFIWKYDEYYHVVSSAYISKNDAELVKNSIKINQNIDSEIFSVKIPKVSIKGSFSGEEKKVLTKAVSSAMTFYSSVYDIAVSVDTGVYNELSAKLAVNSVTNNVATTYANFDTLYSFPVSSPFSELNSYLKSLVKLSQALAADNRHSTAQTYSSHLKYRYLEAISLYINFAKSI